VGAAPTSNETICLEMLCVQPLAYDTDAFAKVMGAKVHLAKLANLSLAPSQRPDWLTRYDASQRNPPSLYALNCGSPSDLELLRSDLALRCTGAKAKLLAQNLDASASGSWLLFDIRFNFFVLLFALTFRIGARDALSQLAQYDRRANPKDDVYNQLRSLLVQEDENSPLSEWAQARRTSAIAAARRVMSECLGLRGGTYAPRILPNTGNISFFVTGLGGADEQENISRELFALNLHAEPSTKAAEPIFLGDGNSLLFCGRFHTAVLHEASYLKRLKLIQFHMQYLWFYLSRLHEQVDRINRNFVDASADDGDHGLERSLAPLVMKIEMLNINNERFKVAIENEAETIYRHVQARWNVEGALRGMGHSLSFLKQHLADLAEQRRARLSRRLNGLLIFISALQIFGLISVWADYLSILNKDQIPTIFGDNQTILEFNLVLPIVLVATLIVTLITLLLIRRRND
jgi:hypothetical protein